MRAATTGKTSKRVPSRGAIRACAIIKAKRGIARKLIYRPTLQGKRIFLWFGGVDEKAKVWVNGKPIGISHGGAFLPFELDATAAIMPGARNVVTVRLD